MTVVIIRFVVLYLSEYSHVTYVNEQNPRSRVKFASAYKEVEMYMQCVCQVNIEISVEIDTFRVK